MSIPRESLFQHPASGYGVMTAVVSIYSDALIRVKRREGFGRSRICVSWNLSVANCRSRRKDA